MTMVEVDPQLFIKCRLCLENSGTYQIVPSVRDQISYCFEINVEPFDGLPQLICKKCQLILSDYSKIKSSFIEKQDELKKYALVNNAPQENEQHKLAAAVKRENSTEVARFESKRRKTSTSSNHLQHNRESNKLSTNKNEDWTKKYQKIYSCTMCNSQWVTKKSALNHNSKHKILKSKYEDIFRRYCVVQLQKFDIKNNLTGSSDHVVYSKSRIISKGNSNYYVSYKHTDTNGKRSSDTDNESVQNEENFNMDESSDESLSRVNEIMKRRCKVRRRICSRSSTETVVLENNSNRKSLDNDCINIDDTDSDEDKHKKVKVSNKNKNNSNTKMQAVSRLITATYNKFLKRQDKPENRPSIDQLNRKIISIGRQIISKRGFNCTRLVKYLEHLNLNVIWLTRSPLNVTSYSNFYKIIPRHRYASEKNINSFEGFRKIYKKPIKSQEILVTTSQEAGFADAAVENADSVIASDVEGTIQSSGLHLFNDTTLLPTTANGESGSTISSDLNMPHHETKKLLNANPVANPRQLPKKFISESKKDKAKPVVGSSTLEVNTDEVSEVTSSGCQNNMQMPIITFTTSLAPQASNEPSNNHKDDPNKENPKPAPRIKVKSVAELMSKETLSRMQESTSDTETQLQQNPQNGTDYIPYGGPESHTMPTIQDVRSLSPRSNCDEYVILDTIEFPNTRTNTPFAYFRSLLQVHNLTLLDTDAELSSDFSIIIKFKVLYKQETKDQPVILCLSLFCLDKLFCLKIKDRNEININMSKISANWQWEILKIYRGDVVTKLLQNAKKISQEVYDNVNSFLCLLKSINFIGSV